MFVHRLKLRPPLLQENWVARPGLEARLRRSVRVMGIVAGPGYGKTVLATRLFHAWHGPRLWYSMDAADADLAVFAMHLDAMTRSLAGSSAVAESWPVGSPKEVGTLFAEAIAEVAAGVLVAIDDVHWLRGSRSLAALEALLERSARIGATFVLSGRSMPLSLHAFAAAGQLVSLGSNDLEFDDDEARSYLERFAPERLDDADAVAMARRAEGWPAGLALIASAAPLARAGARDGAARKEPASASDDEARQLLFDYLATEALAESSDDEREFLLRTSILDVLDVAVCNAILRRNDSAEMLASLARRGLFITRRTRDGFTCHQLFRAFLRHSLEGTVAREDVAALHRSAAEALTRHGDTADAILHRLEAGDVEEAAVALDGSVLSMLRLGLVSGVARLLERIDAERVARRPALLMARGRLQRERGDWDAALATLERAASGARAMGSFDVLAESVRLTAPILASRGEFERLLDTLEDALALGTALPEQSATTLRMTMAAVYIELERYDDALAIYREITPSVTSRGDDVAHGLVLHNTAVAHLRRGDLYAGLALYERALKLKQGSGQRVSSLLTLGDLIYTRMLLGDLDEADQLCATLLTAALDYGTSAIIAHAHENQGMLRVQRGDWGGAEDAFRAAQSACDPGDVLVLPDIMHGLAQCALEKGRVEEADELCAAAVAIFRRAGKRQQMAPILLTRAKALAERGEVQAAVATASEAADASGQGADAVLHAMTSLDAAAFIAGIEGRLPHSEAPLADRRAAQAATTAVALVHQRDYRFLLRTKEASFSALRDHLLRWRVGHGLFAGAAERSGMPLRVEMLGGFEVLVAGQALPSDAWKRRRARDIFAYLVNARGRPVPRARLADLYWSELDADAANDNLRVTISAIRKVLGPVVKFEADGYRFAPPAGTTIDRDAFDEHIERAREAVARGDRDAASKRYASASELYRGDFLDGMDEGGWQWHERERLRAACLEALRWIASDGRDPDAARLALERLLEVAPFDLDAVRMRLDRLVEEMRVSDARRDYAAWRSRYRAAVGGEAPQIWEPFATPA